MDVQTSGYEAPQLVELGDFSEATGQCYNFNEWEVILPLRAFIFCS